MIPLLSDTAETVHSNTAQDYIEFLNKGLCGHKTRMGECLPGYDCTACQHALCSSKVDSSNSSASRDGSDLNTGNCTTFGKQSAFTSHTGNNCQVDQVLGHETCVTISELVFLDNKSIYD
eukprot:12554175-Ditylum_brightwellii.AAC.1